MGPDLEPLKAAPHSKGHGLREASRVGENSESGGIIQQESKNMPTDL